MAAVYDGDLEKNKQTGLGGIPSDSSDEKREGDDTLIALEAPVDSGTQDASCVEERKESLKGKNK